jgi:hypothetical protein
LGLTIARVRVYGHPAHVERCRIQTVESAWKIGIRLNPSEVDPIPCSDPQMAAPENWDPDNAQEWVQSWDDWQQHEGSMRRTCRTRRSRKLRCTVMGRAGWM